ncbi:32011_t:CDS:1, partial [Gigaspora margarita]
MKNLNKEKQENKQIRIEKLFFEQEYIRFRNENLLLKQEIQRIKNEMNNNINAIQKQIYQMEKENRLLKYTRLQFKEVLQKERTR